MIRSATPDDLPLVRELWLEFEAEVPDAPWRDSDSDDDLAALEGRVRDGIVLLAEQDGQAVGLAVAAKTGARLGFLDVLYVRRAARRNGIAAELLREAAASLRAHGAEMLELEVLAANEAARAVYERWGFAPVELTLAAPLDTLAQTGRAARGRPDLRLDPRPDGRRRRRRARRAQGAAAARPLRRHERHRTAQRLGRRARRALQTASRDCSSASPASSRTRSPPSCSRSASRKVRSSATTSGTAASSVDEYLSVPEYFGELPPGDVVALGANPTVVARLTGADPGRVREVARTAATPSELPPATELVEAIAAVMGVAEAGHGWVAA